MSLISIAMATFNGAKFIRQQLASLADQTCLPSELVVSDDDSSDDTLDLVRGFAEDAPFPVRILDRGPRLGFADNFLRAARNCRHDLIALCDQDDVWKPNKLSVVRRRLEHDRSVCCIHRLEMTREDLIPYDVWEQGISSDRVFEPLELPLHSGAWGNSMVFRRDLLDVIPAGERPPQPGVPDRRLFHDTLIYNIASAIGRVSHVMEPLVLYRQHGTNVVGAQRRRFRLAERVYEAVRVPLFIYREQLDFAQYMRDGLRRYGMKSDAIYADHAAEAAEAYDRLRETMLARLSLFESEGVADRLRAYRSLHTAEAGRFRTGARIKHIVLGVSGLNRRLAR